MAATPAFGELKSTKDTIKAPPPEAPFRIVVLGDFSGRANRGEVSSSEEISNRKSFKIGRDNFDDIMKKVGVQLKLADLPGDVTAELKFAALDEIHPDTVYDQVSAFNDLDADEQGKLMSAILHHPHFQGLEAAWRGLYWLLARVKEIKQVQGVLVDLSQDELIADLNASDDLRDSGLYKLLVEKPAAKIEGQPWSLLLGLYTFDFTAEHINTLGRLAKIGREVAAPVLAAVPVAVAGKDWTVPEEVAPLWEALRKIPEAAMLGLAMPGFLLRQPYGSDTKSIDRFSYEEWPGIKGPDLYLWGNPALACACLLAQSFAKEGWACKAGTVLELGEMVMHAYTDEDDDRVSRLAEAMLTRKEGEKVGPLGLMNFVCSKNRDVMQLIRFQALAAPAKGQAQVDLLGQWGQKGAIKLPAQSGKPGVTASVAFAGGPVAEKPPAAKPAAKAAKAAPPEEEPDEASAEEPAAAEPAAAAAGADEVDPELAALMNQLEGGASGGAAAKEDKPAAEEEMDPELAALMKQLEGGGDEAPAAAKKEEKKEEEMDPELAALMKQLEGGDTPAEEKKEEPKPAEEEMDPELAALMKQLEGGGEPAAEAKPEEKPPEDEMDPELAALMKQLEG